MPRTNAPIGIDAAITKVKAKAKDFIKDSTPTKPAAWGRTFVEPDKSVYITADKEKSLISKWESTTAIDDRFNMKGSGSSNGAQVDLKLQLKADWGTSWKAGTSPFVYHIPIDSYEDPAEKKRLAEEKKKNEEAIAKRNKEAELKKQQEEAEKKKKELLVKAQKKMEADRTVKMNTAWNGLGKKQPKDKNAWQTQWLKDNASKFKIDNYMK